MRSYKIVVTRNTTESCVLSITASNEDEAHDNALNRANDDKLLWETDEGNCNERPYVTGIDVCPETE